MWRKLLFIPPLALGVAVLVWTMKNRPEPVRNPPAEEVRAVRVIEIRPLTVLPRARGFGTVRPDRVWTAVAQVGGKVTFVHPRLKKGEIIARGEEIITIAPDDYQLAIARAESAIRGAEAKLAELDINEDNARRLLKLESEALQIARRDYERKKTLKAQGTIPATVLEQALRAFISQRKLVASIENTLRLIPAQKRELKEQLATYRSQLETAKLNLARTHIRMPFAGRISQVAVETGQFTPAGRQLAAADSIRAAEVEAQYPLSRLREVISLISRRPAHITLDARENRKVIAQLGLKVRIRLDDGPRAVVWEGRFDRLSDTADPKTRTMGVIGVVENPYQNVSPGGRPPLTKGMFVRMDVIGRPVKDVIAIPRAAVRSGKVFIAGDGNRLAIRPVKITARMGNLAIVSSGLKPGERVVLTDLVPALAGQLLNPVVDRQAMAAIAREAAGSDAP